VIDESEKRLTIERKRIFLDERIVSLENTLEKKMRKADIGGLPKNFTDEEEIEKRIFRNAVTRAVYTALSEKTGQKLPWGTLTGIRPTKQILWCLAAGNAERTVKEYYRKNYLLSEEKLELALTVAKNENNLLTVKGDQSYFNNGFSLYIDIQFCPST
jgi:oxygen-independent coproporphyrinogen-3 oxidase